MAFGKTKVTAPRDPVRAALAAAHAERDQAEAGVSTARGSLDRLEDQFFAAQRRLAEVRAEAGQAVEQRVAALVAGGDALVVDRDRFAVRDAEEAAMACKAARDLCRVVLADAESSLGFKKRKVDAAIGEVAAGEIDKHIALAEALRLAAGGEYAIVRLLVSHAPAGSEAARLASLALGLAVGRGEQYPGPADHPMVGPWRGALEALKRDADAPLPEQE